MIKKGVYGINNILNSEEISYYNPFSYIPLLDDNDEDYSTNLYDWIFYHAPTCRKVCEVLYEGVRFIIPGEFSKLHNKTSIFNYSTNELTFIKNKYL